jgi:hypothetical protein
MSEKRIDDELAVIEAALGTLTPAVSSVGRDRLMFLAGRASAGNSRARRQQGITAWLWPCAMAASLLVAATFGLLWAAGNNPRPVEPSAGVSVASLPAIVELPADTSPPSPWANRQMCRLVLEKGIDALPQSKCRCSSGTWPVQREETYRSLLKQFLDNPTS